MIIARIVKRPYSVNVEAKVWDDENVTVSLVANSTKILYIIMYELEKMGYMGRYRADRYGRARAIYRVRNSDVGRIIAVVKRVVLGPRKLGHGANLAETQNVP